MVKTRSTKNPPPATKVTGSKHKEKRHAAKKEFWKKRLAALCDRVDALEQKMIPDTWTPHSYDLFDACRVERSELFTRISWILTTKFRREHETNFHISTRVETALSLLE